LTRTCYTLPLKQAQNGFNRTINGLYTPFGRSTLAVTALCVLNDAVNNSDYIIASNGRITDQWWHGNSSEESGCDL